MSDYRIPSALPKLLNHTAPINKAAARELFPPAPEPQTSKQPHTLCPVPPAEIRRRHASNFRDLTGMQAGRIRIVGLIEYKEDGKSVWSGRCECGSYERRRHSSFWNVVRLGVNDGCERCLPRWERHQAIVLAKAARAQA